MLNRLFSRAKDDATASAAAAALAAPENKSSADATAQQSSYTVAVLGAKGGAGATTIALNLAAAFAASGTATTLLDCNLHEPGLAHSIGKEPPHSLMELVSRSNEIDRKLYEACAMPIADELPGLTLISPPVNGTAGVQTNLSHIAQCLGSLRQYSAMWLIDVPRHLDRHLVTLLDSCDRVMLVFEASLAGIASCQRWLATFKELGYEREKLIVVLNRAGSKYRVAEEQLQNCFGDEVILKVPNASALAWDSVMHGTPAVLSNSGHQYSRALSRLADHVIWSVSAR